jgi:ABC-2 type transport system permease protein
MLAIYKKELRSYFTSMIGYVFIAFFLVIIGIYFYAYSLINYNYANFEYTLSSVSFIFILLVPFLTMRLMAEENKQKTDQLLYTSPLTAGSIVMGKFLAVFTIFIAAMAIVSLYPLIMSHYGTISFGMAYASIFGFIVMGGAYMAIGLFISSMTESQVVAAVVSFIVFLITGLMESLAGFIPADNKTAYAVFIIFILILCLIVYKLMNNLTVAVVLGVIGVAGLTVVYIVGKTLFDGSVVKFFGWFSAMSRYKSFSYGIFDLSSIIYYLSIIFVFTFLTTQVIKKKRWS